MKNEKYFADDRPINYDRYMKMSEEELEDEMLRLEREQREQEKKDGELVNV